MKLSRISELRKNKNLKQEEIAKIIGVARTTYSMYEHGNRQMDYETIIKLADYYKVSLDYIFERTNNPIHLESYTDEEIEFMMKALNLYNEMKNKYKWAHIPNEYVFLIPKN